MSIRRVSLFAIAGAAGLFTAVAAFAATDEDAQVQRRVVVIEDGQEVEVDGPEAFEFEIPDIVQFRELAGEMAPMIRAFRGGHPMMMDRGDRAEHLREMLQLTPAQEPALQAFVAATTHEPKFEPAEFEAEDALTTPERIVKARARMAEHQAAFERRADAVGRFYGQLSASQKKVFDKLPGADGLGPNHFRMIRFDQTPKTPRTPTTPATPRTPTMPRTPETPKTPS